MQLHPSPIERARGLLRECDKELAGTIQQNLEVLAEAASGGGRIPQPAFEARAAISGQVETMRRQVERSLAELNAADKRINGDSAPDLRSEAVSLAGQIAAIERDARAKVRAVVDAREDSVRGEVDRLRQLKDSELAERRDAIAALRVRIADAEKFADHKLSGLRDHVAALEQRVDGVVGMRKSEERLSAAAERGLDAFLQALVEEKPSFFGGRVKGC
jgi:hypothetical protein